MTFKTRAPRIRLSPLHRVQFNLLDKGRETPIGVGNISKSGMGLLREAVKADVGSV